MNTYHHQTIHTWESVRSVHSMDWSVQPKVFKEYPETFSTLALSELPDLEQFLSGCCGLTARKIYPGGSYWLRVNPSAGALYPCELYLQARNVPDLADGIYHYEPLVNNLRLLHVLDEKEGLEGYWEEAGKVDGLVLLVTAVYSRSSWKYGSRALRYCLLDSGHVLGSIEAASLCRSAAGQLTDQDYTGITRFNRPQLQADCGFEKNELPMAMVCCGRKNSFTVSRPTMQLPCVNSSGSFVPDLLIESAFQGICTISGRRTRCGSPYPVCRDELAGAMHARRSIRSFTGRPLTQKEYQVVLQAARSSIGIDCDVPLELFVVVNRVEGMTSGLYKDGRCLRPGDLSEMAGYLCLEQALGAESGATVFLVGGNENYLPLMLKAGIVGQRIYLAATLLGFGCSGIGAFYDKEVADFLETDGLILYGLAFGR